MVMSTLEVVYDWLVQHKSLLSTLGVTDPFDAHLISFDLDKVESIMPSLAVFQLLVTIKNLAIHQCILINRPPNASCQCISCRNLDPLN